MTPIPRWAEPFGARAALRAALHARQRVPAYRSFLAAAGRVDDASLSGGERLARFPVTDKKSYVLRYSIAERCIDQRERSHTPSSRAFSRPRRMAAFVD